MARCYLSKLSSETLPSAGSFHQSGFLRGSSGTFQSQGLGPSHFSAGNVSYEWYSSFPSLLKYRLVQQAFPGQFLALSLFSLGSIILHITI